jgi:hypothetical protein
LLILEIICGPSWRGVRYFRERKEDEEIWLLSEDDSVIVQKNSETAEANKIIIKHNERLFLLKDRLTDSRLKASRLRLTTPSFVHPGHVLELEYRKDEEKER